MHRSVIEEGRTAPSFELPAVVDGDHRPVALSEYIGDDIVILAFFPAVFNPSCDVESDLDQLDLFTMQPDVTVLAVGPDTLYANEAFAAEYDLHIPLLADTKREVASAYDVAYEDGRGQSLIARSVFVIDHDGQITYAWSSRDLASLANVDEIKDALGDTGGDDTAFSRYRVGHAHYLEGRRAFTSAMGAYSESDWMMAQADLKRARDEFEEAERQFTSAVRFVDDELHEAHYDAAKEKSSALWQASDWLARSANEFSSGAGGVGEELRSDAERPLENARTWPDPPDPDDEWPPEEPPERTDPEGDLPAYLVDDDDEPATLDVELDEDALDAAELTLEENEEGPPTEARTSASTGGEESEVVRAGEPDGDDIGDDELAEIEAEVAASGPEEPLDDPTEEDGSVGNDTPGARANGETADDPADGEALDADLASGGGGDSLEVDADGGSAAPGDLATSDTPEDTGHAENEDGREGEDSTAADLGYIPSEAELEDEAAETDDE
jgi:peroxiredoxin